MFPVYVLLMLIMWSTPGRRLVDASLVFHGLEQHVDHKPLVKATCCQDVLIKHHVFLVNPSILTPCGRRRSTLGRRLRFDEIHCCSIGYSNMLIKKPWVGATSCQEICITPYCFFSVSLKSMPFGRRLVDASALKKKNEAPEQII